MCVCVCVCVCVCDMGFPGASDGKESTCNAGDLSSIPGLGRSPGGGHGNPLRYSCLENPMDRGAWQGSQRVGHNWATKHIIYNMCCIYTYYKDKYTHSLTFIDV